MLVFENKEHFYKLARLVVFCSQHIGFGFEKEKRGHIVRLTF
jgi:hypothetical protein